MLRIFLTIAVSVPTCDSVRGVFENKTDQELLNEHLALQKSRHIVQRATIDR